MNTFDTVLMIVFTIIAVFLTIQFIKVNKKISIKSKRASNFKLILLGSLLVMNILTLLVYTTIVDIVRVVVIGIVIILFMILKDGVGPEGVVIGTSFIPYEYISAYDYAQEKKGFKLFVEYRDEVDRKKNRGPFISTVTFDKQKEKEVLELLQNKLPKRYKRMKKS